MKTLLKKLCLFIVLVIMSTGSAFAIQYPETISSVVYLQTIDSSEESYSGTGVIISKDALILTAAHVVIDENTGEPNEYIDICLIEDAYSTPNCQYSGYVFAYDSVLDLALIEIGKELDENLQEIGDEYISIEEA